MRRNRITLTCTYCHNLFEARPSESSKKYCSNTCYRAHHHVQKTCIVCGETFKTGIHKGKTQVTCGSEECKKVTTSKLGEYNPFYGRNHSEESKRKVSQTKRGQYTEVECTCGCGEKFELPGYRINRNKTSTFFVNREHMHKWLVGENHWEYRGGSIYYGDGWAKTAKAIRERDKICQMCGKTPEENGKALDVHHINPARVSRDNSPENLIALCMSCHRKISASEQYDYPHKVTKYRKCLVCDKIFIPEPLQKICSDECRRKRTRQWEKKYIDSHPEAYTKRRQRITKWQQTNKDKVNESHQKSRQRRKTLQTQEGAGLFDQLD